MQRAGPGAPPDNTLITQDEIDSAHVYNAYDAIRRLRPEFLVSRGKMSLNPNVPPEVEPEIVWAKFRSLTEGARLATKQLWG